MQLWNGVQTIDIRIDDNLVEIRATQQVLAPKVDNIEKRLLEILEHIDHGDEIKGFSIDKGSLEMINDKRNVDQMMRQSR